MRGAVGLDFEDDGRGFFIALQGLTKRIGQSHWLQSHAEVATRNAAFLQERIDDGVHRGCGNRDRAEASEARRGDADHAAMRVDDRAARGGRLNRDVEPNVGSERARQSKCALRGDEADDAERGNRSAGARTANDET